MGFIKQFKEPITYSIFVILNSRAFGIGHIDTSLLTHGDDAINHLLRRNRTFSVFADDPIQRDGRRVRSCCRIKCEGPTDDFNTVNMAKSRQNLLKEALADIAVGAGIVGPDPLFHDGLHVAMTEKPAMHEELPSW
ncbi:hypothetical protein [Komagataeibacter europaeus]|uniref:hypothetical protein n=1 Tax=Komagataeibacter europaeus TaxID=33995 RepID=UPI0011DDB7F5|nr:hypothetical protein [Komagataeibacter europaeus]